MSKLEFTVLRGVSIDLLTSRSSNEYTKQSGPHKVNLRNVESQVTSKKGKVGKPSLTLAFSEPRIVLAWKTGTSKNISQASILDIRKKKRLRGLLLLNGICAT